MFNFCRLLFYFFPVNNTKVVIDNFCGKGFGDNLKYIANELIKKDLKLEIVWLTNNKSNMPENIRIVPYGSLISLFELGTAKIWIDNVRNSIKPLKKNNQYYLQTWHGAFPSKLIEGEDNKISSKYINLIKKDGKITNGIITGGPYLHSVIEKNFFINNNTERLNCSEPKYDLFFDTYLVNQERLKLRKFYNISDNDFVVLYAPTFRDNHSVNGYIDNFDSIKISFKNRFNKNPLIFSKLHLNSGDIQFNSSITKINKEFDINSLYCFADALITDYSSVGIEFPLFFKKPTFLYYYDIDEYLKYRTLSPLYLNLPFNKNRNIIELCYDIEHYDSSFLDSDYFQNILYTPGNGSVFAVNWIISKIRTM